MWFRGFVRPTQYKKHQIIRHFTVHDITSYYLTGKFFRIIADECWRSVGNLLSLGFLVQLRPKAEKWSFGTEKDAHGTWFSLSLRGATDSSFFFQDTLLFVFISRSKKGNPVSTFFEIGRLSKTMFATFNTAQGPDRCIASVGQSNRVWHSSFDTVVSAIYQLQDFIRIRLMRFFNVRFRCIPGSLWTSVHNKHRMLTISETRKISRNNGWGIVK